MNPRTWITMLAALAAIAACGGTERASAPAHEEDAHAEEGARVALTAEQIETAGIGRVVAGPALIRETLPLYGVIAPNAERMREVAARYPGVIRSVARQVGDAVRQGETLATVESNESLETYAVAAPLSGVVIARSANPGEQSGDKVLFTVADLSTVWAELALFPRDVGKVRVGQRVRILNSDARLSGEGAVSYVAPFGSSASQTLTARVLLENPERRWAPGLYVSAEVTLGAATVPVALRNEALQTLDGHSSVFVQSARGFEPRTVRLGRADREYSEVLEGLEPGETYATRNSFILKAELAKGEATHGH